MRRLPVGIQSFADLRRNGYVYVDKTEYIWNLVSQGKAYFLSRPRRFGKSLLVSTLEAYFKGEKELFRELRMEEMEETRPEELRWTEYPVIRFSLSGGMYEEAEGLRFSLEEVLRQTEIRYGIDSPGETDISARFRRDLRELYQKTGKQVVVLVDEYDKPLLDPMTVNSHQEQENRSLYRGFFSVLKDQDEYLKFVFFTGVTKFSKVSVFSDLNQLRDISLLPEFSGICGITEAELEDNFSEEIQNLAEAQNMSTEEAKNTLCRMYDGYHFSRNSMGVYNPFSILSAFADRSFGSYWFESGTPTFLVRILNQWGGPVQDLTTGVAASESRLKNFRADDSDLIPLFYQSGYLTISGYDQRFREYTLTFPNDEVKYGFLQFLIPKINNGTEAPDTEFSASKMIRYLENGETNAFLQMIRALLSSIPYHEGQPPQNEQQWRNLIYVLFAVLGQYIAAEEHSSRGRCDFRAVCGSYVYIFEFKQDESPEAALQQIHDKGYAEPWRSGSRQIMLIGANFSSGKRTLDNWKTEKL